MTRNAYKASFNLAVGVLLTSVAAPATAEFSLNFQPVGDRAIMVTHSVHGASFVEGQTPYLTEGIFQLPELVADPESGDVFYHMIIGDEADGFIQETFIEAGYRAFPGGSGSAVGGDGGVLGFAGTSGGNGRDPLNRDPGINTANAEANPRRVLVRQIVSDGEIRMEYLKDRYDRKALITQSLSTSEITAAFSIDMRNSGYDDASTAGLISNSMDVTDANGVNVGAFDMATDVQTSAVSGGRYTYADGDGPGGSNGSYQYFDGGYDHRDVNWEALFDQSADNPWSYLENRP
ncbi:hypothetical protein Tel_01645 [Candidatus Tenderia electrophaga]|mgnify:FL=1|jgi:hypothetical protein|uniref:Spondin domain-containing protein n=1 Tax=Candidatus Tenderia electrophaga TaxID=1748243 RepID=A0A0S2T9V7_9GAMM|nr:hypothetical protein Tel_01645 [Candidatus Tenderia electrophaga]